MAGLGQLTIDLAANITRFERALTKAERLAQKRSDNIRKTFVRMSGAIGATIGSIGFARLVDEALEFGTTLENTAQKLGLTVEALQELRFAADQTGVPVQALDVGIQRFTRRLGEASTGTGVLASVMTDLGIELRNNDGTMRSTEDVLNDYADAIQNAESSQQQLLLAFKAFDTEGAALVNTLRGGSEGLERLRNAARDTGGILSSTLTESAKQINDRWSVLVDTIGNKFKAAVITAVDSALNLFNVFNNLADVQGRLIEIENKILETEIQLEGARGRNAKGAKERLNRLQEEQLELQGLEESLIKARAARDLMFAPGEGVSTETGDVPGLITGKTNAEIDAELAYTEEILNKAATAHNNYINQKIKQEQNFVSVQQSLQNNVLNNTVALFSTLGQKSKGFALAAIAIQKGLAIAETIMATNVAVMRAFEFYGPTPAGYAAAANMKALGAINVGLIAATGLAQAASVSSSGGGGGTTSFGTVDNPVFTTDVTENFTTQPPGTQGTITINVNGVVTDEILQDLIIPAIQDATDNKDIILFRSDSRQALELI